MSLVNVNMTDEQKKEIVKCIEDRLVMSLKEQIATGKFRNASIFNCTGGGASQNIPERAVHIENLTIVVDMPNVEKITVVDRRRRRLSSSDGEE